MFSNQDPIFPSSSSYIVECLNFPIWVMYVQSLTPSPFPSSSTVKFQYSFFMCFHYQKQILPCHFGHPLLEITTSSKEYGKEGFRPNTLPWLVHIIYLYFFTFFIEWCQFLCVLERSGFWSEVCLQLVHQWRLIRLSICVQKTQDGFQPLLHRNPGLRKINT